MESFGRFVRRLRKSQKCTQVRLAKEIGLSRFQLSQLEADSVLPKEINLMKMAAVLKTDLPALKLQFFGEKVAQELHRHNCTLETLTLAREKLIYLQTHHPTTPESTPA
ncbi:helix-turn-helix domain-containing protein [Rufibacter latericius]|nr:helix-turn-helix transcriptional regulator [Rufibacter latericius]